MLKKKTDVLDKQSEKLLKDFFKKNNSLDRRWRSFHAFREAKVDEPQELAKFYADNFHVVFTLLQDGVAEFSALAAKGKRDPKYLDEVMVLLQTIVEHLSELIGRQWQTKALADIICNTLYKENKLELRMRGLDIYMSFMTAVKMRDEDWKELKDIVCVFGQCFLFQPYVLAGKSVKFPFYPLEATSDVAVWMPATGSPSETDADTLFKRAFETICRQTENDFVFWVRMLKENFFSVTFPKVCKSGLISGDDTGFVDECPPKLIRLIFSDLLEKWMRDTKKSALVWADASNAQLLLEIYSQGMAMGTADADVSTGLLQMFCNVFFSGTPHSEVASRLGAYRVYYLKRLAGVFSKPTAQGTLPIHKKLCQDSIKVLEKCSRADNLEKSALDLILAVPLTGLASVVKNSPLAVEVIRELTYAALKRWVIMQPETSWKPLETVMLVTFGASQQAIDAAFDMWMQVTLLVQKFYYPTRAAKESKRKLGAAGQATADHFSRSPDWRPVKEAPEPDADIALVTWNAKSALQMWTNVRNLFVGLSSITETVKHTKAVDAVVAVADYLIRQEAMIPYEMLSLPDQPRPLELLDVFGPVLCESFDIPDAAARVSGRASAAAGLCRLFCRQTDPVPLVVLQYVYAAIAKELEESPTSAVSMEIIANCGSIFSLALPGVFDLIPYFLNAIWQIIAAPMQVPDRCFRNCIAIPCSLICFPSHFPDLEIKCSLKSPVLPLPDRTLMSSADLYKLVGQIMSAFLAKALEPEHVFLGICGLTVSVMSECRMVSPRPQKKQVTESLTKIIQQCSSANIDVATGALHCLADLAVDAPALVKFDGSLLPLVLVGLSNSIIEQLSAALSDKRYQVVVPAVVAAFKCLEEWTLAVPASVVENSSVNRALFTAIEIGIFDTASTAASSGPSGSRKKLKESVASPSAHTLGHGSKEISEAAEVLLRAMLNLHSQWPGPGGAELTGTVLKESEVEDAVSTYFFANGSILSLAPQGNGSVRMIVRDEMDRYAWDAQVLFDEGGQNNGLQALPGRGVPSAVRLAVPAARLMRPMSDPPMWTESESAAASTDKVEDLLMYLDRTYEDCHYTAESIDVADEIKPLVEETARVMGLQEEAMQSAPDVAADPLELPSRASNASEHHWARLVLSHFSIVDYDQRAMYSMLESGMPLQRSINTLDTKRAREAFKVGLLYVCKGQDSQEQILPNEVRSQYYDAFVRALAQEVNMATHRGYIGGLDTTKFLTGTTAPYHSTARLELMFHDITCMPTNHDDPQQIHKKRHVGNDVVNVVFSEHCKDYDPATISTQFNCAHIIVYPLPNGLYRIQICRKEEEVYPLFGPLVHNMAVSSDILPLLVRQTCLNANRNFTSHKAGYLLPFPNRAKDVTQLLSRYREDNVDYTKTLKASFGYNVVAEKKK